MRKRVIRGWLPRSVHIEPQPKGIAGMFQLSQVWGIKGKQGDYHEDDWPPRKLKITIEEV